MNNRIKISYCIVTYNNVGKINEVISNIESVSKNFIYEIFLVDNGSSDGTLEKVRENIARNPNIKLIRPSKNLGFGGGHNQVIPLLSSDYHVVINPDVIISPGQIEIMLRYMEANSEVGLLSPLILNPDGSIQKLYKYNPSVFDMGIRFMSPKVFRKRQQWFVHENSGYNTIGNIEHASGAFMFFRTSIFRQIAGFDERYFMYMEDADITRKVNLISRAVFLPFANVTHEWQRQSHKNIRFMFYTLSSMVKYFNKWGWKMW